MGSKYRSRTRRTTLGWTLYVANNKWHATMNANADQLKAAPEYKYPSKT